MLNLVHCGYVHVCRTGTVIRERQTSFKIVSLAKQTWTKHYNTLNFQ